MNFIFILAGLIIGVAQSILLKCITVFLSRSKKKLAIAVAAKLLIYAAAFACVFLLFVKFMLWFCIGLGVGLVGTAALVMLKTINGGKE